MKSQRRAGWVLVAAALLALPAGRPALAQEPRFKNTVELYLMGAAMSGTVGVGELSSDIDVPASQIFDHLDFAVLGNYRGESRDWAVAADVVYMNLGATGTGSHGGQGNANVDQLVIDLVGAYRLSERLEILAGARYTDLGTDAYIYGPHSELIAKASVDQGWVDPVIGLQTFLPISKAFLFNLRADIGGFGVGCDFTWQATARVNWQVSRVLHVGAGYRWLDQDYTSGSGRDRFHWNVLTQGPILAVGATF